jgi:hypothetical protein
MTLQMLRVMDRLWIRPPHNLDLRLNPYGCCSTGQDLGKHTDDYVCVLACAITSTSLWFHYVGSLLMHVPGMIEVVKNSKTTSEIQRQFGGRNLGALKSTPIQLYLNQHNKGDIYRYCPQICTALFIFATEMPWITSFSLVLGTVWPPTCLASATGK